MLYCYIGAQLNNLRWSEQENWSGYMLVLIYRHQGMTTLEVGGV